MYYLTTTFAAVVLGIVLVLMISPGTKGGSINRTGAPKEQEPLEALLDLIRYKEEVEHSVHMCM